MIPPPVPLGDAPINIKNIINIPFDKRVVDAISNKEIPSIAVKDIFEKSGILTLAESISQAGTK